MNVLILKNITHEGPGTIEDFLRERKIPYRIVDLSTLVTMKGEVGDTSPFTHLVMMGGPMAVYEMDKYSFLKTGASVLKEFLQEGKAVLGVCLGAQMMAHVLGGRVYPGGEKEIGWYKVDVTEEGEKDIVFKNLLLKREGKAEVFQWHGDTFDLPKNAIRLASSPLYPNQAFRWGERAYALQFHIEVTPEIIKDWFADDPRRDEMTEYSRRIYGEYFKRAFKFYKEFFRWKGGGRVTIK
jgi:GMP synthase (glutamine-hydrolysing)